MLSGQGGYSAQVKMRLLVNGDVLSVAQMGPDFLLVDEPIDHPALQRQSDLARGPKRAVLGRASAPRHFCHVQTCSDRTDFKVEGVYRLFPT